MGVEKQYWIEIEVFKLKSIVSYNAWIAKSIPSTGKC